MPVNWDYQPLGKVTDISLAEKVGVSREAVRQVRNRRGIPRYSGFHKKKKDLTGQKFSHLEVISLHEERDYHGSLQWNCKCDCGNFTVVSSPGLKSSSTRSCGCLREETYGHRFIDLTGQRFGRWLVLKLAGKKSGNTSYWRCICDCGTEKDVLRNGLRNGSSKSCGCLRRELLNKKRKV